MTAEDKAPDDLTLWRLRDNDEQVIVVRHGTYGKPVLHRLIPKHPGRAIGPGHPRLPDPSFLGFDLVERLWLAETLDRAAGRPSTVEFCQHCVCEKATS